VGAVVRTSGTTANDITTAVIYTVTAENESTQDYTVTLTAADPWTQKIDFRGTARHSAAGFAVGSKGYIGTGMDGGWTKDFWEYDPSLSK